MVRENSFSFYLGNSNWFLHYWNFHQADIFAVFFSGLYGNAIKFYYNEFFYLGERFIVRLAASSSLTGP